MKNCRIAVWVIAFVMSASVGADTQSGAAAGATASPAAFYPLEDFAGQTRTVDEFAGQGRWLVVMIWASDCHICNEEVPEYMAFHDAHNDKDASVLGLSMDGDTRHKEAEAFIDRHLVNFPSLIGEPQTVMSLYRHLTGESLAGTPAFLVYDPKGELAAKQVGAVPVKVIEDFIGSKQG